MSPKREDGVVPTSGDTDLAEAAEAAREALSRALEAKGLPPVQAPQKRKRKAKKA